MPMYQYACRECEHGFEKKLRMSQSGETQTCPACGGQQTRKRLGAIAVSIGRMSRSQTFAAPPPSSPFS